MRKLLGQIFTATVAATLGVWLVILLAQVAGVGQ